MHIVNIPFEKPLQLEINGKMVHIIAFKTQEHGNIKFGVEAPRAIQVHREEIYHAIKQQKTDASISEPN